MTRRLKRFISDYSRKREGTGGIHLYNAERKKGSAPQALIRGM